RVDGRVGVRIGVRIGVRVRVGRRVVGRGHHGRRVVDGRPVILGGLAEHQDGDDPADEDGEAADTAQDEPLGRAGLALAAFLVLLVAVAATRAGGQAPGWRVVLAADALLAARAVFYFLLVPAARGALRRPGGDGGRARRPSFGVAALLPFLVL